ncbi:fas-binding factor 1 isoform X3 [Petromyzon marinus]|uniref:Fas-binding factor 1 isoform X3 n=1 Tax=Petromyzon marinus TaxID=7757 RepID=A0AAJ7TTU4_PETMA|nr:fas-binding factor 1 isoform X3 [Petromyzon marinus]
MDGKSKKDYMRVLDADLTDLLGDEDESIKKPPSRITHGGGSGRINTGKSKSSVLDEDFFSKLAAEAENDEPGSDVSDADPQAVLNKMEDIDDMDADLFGKMKKTGPPASQHFKAGPGQLAQTRGPKTPVPAVTECTAQKKSQSSPAHLAPAKVVEDGQKGISGSPAIPAHPYKKYSFNDDDPLDGLLSDEEETKNMKEKKPLETEKAKPQPSDNSAAKNEFNTAPLPASSKRPVGTSKRCDEITFDDDGDDLVDALGMSDSPKSVKKEASREEDDRRPARSKFDELLGRGTASKLLERPATGERKDSAQQQRAPGSSQGLGEEEFTFGSYMPSAASSAEGRRSGPSSRRSVRFYGNDNQRKAEEADIMGGLDRGRDKLSTSATPGTPTILATPPQTTQSSRGGPSDWLGLKGDSFDDPKEPASKQNTQLGTSKMGGVDNAVALEPIAVTPSAIGSSSRKLSLSDSKLGAPIMEHAGAGAVIGDDDEDWLLKSLSRKKSQVSALGDDKKIEGFRGSGVDASISKSGITSSSQHDDLLMDSSAEDRLAATHKNRNDSATPTLVSSSRREHLNGHDARIAALIGQPMEQSSFYHAIQPQLGPGYLSQSLFPGNPLSYYQPCQQAAHLMTPQAHGQAILGQAVGQSFIQTDSSQQTQAFTIELDTKQMRRLQMERDQLKSLLDTVQQRHKEDMDILEEGHKQRVRLLQDSWERREASLRQELEEAAGRHSALQREAESERARLASTWQCRVADAEQEAMRQAERLAELQRHSIMEMRRDHEEQIQRLKRLKDQEIDAVTSATSQTRSLNGVIEQMESLSGRMGELTNRVESTHHSSTHELEMETRSRTAQLHELKDRLDRQHRDMEEERARLQYVISKMEARLGEQTRQLEQERWKVKSEQGKMESLKRGLEEERRVMMQQLNLEREELDRAKTLLLKEQEAVMARCGEERKRLAAESAEAQEWRARRADGAEREAARQAERDAQREAAVIKLAQSQADLTVRAGDLKSREDQLNKEREVLERERQELQREREKLNALAQSLNLQAQELDSMMKASSEKYADGERVLRQARRIEGEHQSRLDNIHHQMEALREHEQRVVQEKASMAQERRNMGHLPGTPTPKLHSKYRLRHMDTHCNTSLPPSTSGANLQSALVQSLTSSAAAELHAKLTLFKHTASQDRDFLEDEEHFLRSLKKSSNQSSLSFA